MSDDKQSEPTEEKKQWGGPRKRSGRPRGEGGKSIRIPTALIEPVETIIKAYKEAKATKKE